MSGKRWAALGIAAALFFYRLSLIFYLPYAFKGLEADFSELIIIPAYQHLLIGLIFSWKEILTG